MKCCVCRATLVPLGGPAQPFVRVYGWARHVPLMGYDRVSQGGTNRETVAERQGWTREDTDRAGIPPTVLDPAIAIRVREGELDIVEHPIACAKMECVVRMLAALDEDGDEGWYRNDRTFRQETGSMSMQVSEYADDALVQGDDT